MSATQAKLHLQLEVRNRNTESQRPRGNSQNSSQHLWEIPPQKKKTILKYILKRWHVVWKAVL